MALTGAATCVVVSAAAHAQAKGPTSGLASDTMIQPGHLHYSRYTTPGMCLQSAALAMRVSERAQVDTAFAHQYAPERDTLPTAAVTVARACGGRFTAEAVPVTELPNLIRLSLMAGDDARAQAAAARWRAVRREPALQAWAEVGLFMLYASARPMRLTAIEESVARLDSLGPAALGASAAVHGLLTHLAAARFDVPAIEQRGFAAITRDARLGPDGGPAAREATLAFLHYDLDVPPAIRIVGGDVLALAAAAAYHSLQALAELPTKVREAGAETPRRTLFLTMGQLMFAPVPVSPLPAKFWYGNQGPHRWPVPRRVSLYVDVSSLAQFGTLQYPTYAILRRLHERYGDDVNITLLHRTQGHFRDGPPLTPSAEADAVRAYYLDYLKLPVNLAVDETPFTTLPDGRRMPGQAASMLADGYGAQVDGHPMRTSFILVDQQGRSIIRSLNMAPEPMLEAFINRALGRTQPGPTQPGGPSEAPVGKTRNRK